MAATALAPVRTTSLPSGTAATPLDARAVDQLLAGTGYVLEVEQCPDELPAGLFPPDDAELRAAAADGWLRCYEVTLATASGTELTRATVWSAAGVRPGAYTSCAALGTALAEELAEGLARALARA